MHDALDSEARKVVPLFKVEKDIPIDLLLFDGRGVLRQLERVGKPARHRCRVHLLHLSTKICMRC